jgi:hypothetical protein
MFKSPISVVEAEKNMVRVYGRQITAKKFQSSKKFILRDFILPHDFILREPNDLAHYVALSNMHGMADGDISFGLVAVMSCQWSVSWIGVEKSDQRAGTVGHGWLASSQQDWKVRWWDDGDARMPTPPQSPAATTTKITPQKRGSCGHVLPCCRAAVLLRCCAAVLLRWVWVWVLCCCPDQNDRLMLVATACS